MDDNLICARHRLETYDLWSYAVDAVMLIRALLIKERVLHKIYTYLEEMFVIYF